jgi:hypothetical protein
MQSVAVVGHDDQFHSRTGGSTKSIYPPEAAVEILVPVNLCQQSDNANDPLHQIKIYSLATTRTGQAKQAVLIQGQGLG